MQLQSATAAARRTPCYRLIGVHHLHSRLACLSEAAQSRYSNYLKGQELATEASATFVFSPIVAMQTRSSSKFRRISSSGQRAAVASIDDESDSEEDNEIEEDEENSSSASENADSGSNSDDSFGTSVAKKRLSKDVRKSYNSRIRAIKRFAIRNGFSTSVVNGVLKCPLSLELVTAYFKHLSEVMIKWTKHAISGTMKNLAPGTINRVAAVIKDFYRQQYKEVEPPIHTFLSNFNRWYILFISAKMSADPPEYPVDALSVPLGDVAWKLLLLRVWQARPTPGHTWASINHLRTFLNMAKPLLGRQERVTRVHYQYMRWKKDALGAKIPTTKSDQAGKLSYLKLLYASPEDPETCVMLSLALEVCSKSRFDNLNSFQTVFSSTFRNSLYANFRAFIDNLADEDKAAMQVGTCKSLPITLHTPKRTGSVLLHSSETVQWDHCKQRADHAIDNEGSYVIHPSEQADGIMGRILAGLEFGSQKFELQTPHFDPHLVSSLPMERLIPGYGKFPEQLRELYPYFIANIVFHFEWLKKNLPSDSPEWASVPLFTTERDLLTHLSAKDESGNFVHIFGGKVGVKSFLPLSGKSLVSEDHATLQSLNRKFDEFLTVWEGGSNMGSVRVHAVQNPREVPMSNALSRKVCEIHDMLTGNSAPVGLGRMQPCQQLPIAQLPSSFKIATGLRHDQLFRKWFCGLGTLPAWRHITKEQLPTKGKEGRAQRDLFTKYQIVMKFIIGPAVCDNIIKDIEGSIVSCWTRACTAAGWPLTTTWSGSTIYDKLTPTLRATLEAAPPFQFTSVQIQAQSIASAAVPAFIGSLLEVQRNRNDAVAAAQNQLSAAIDASNRSETEIGALISGVVKLPLPLGWRVPTLGQTVENFWMCWHGITAVGGLNARWRDIDLIISLKKLRDRDPVAFPTSKCKQDVWYVSQSVQVIETIRAGITLAEIDADVVATFTSCIAAANLKYGNIFLGSTRTAWEKMTKHDAAL